MSAATIQPVGLTHPSFKLAFGAFRLLRSAGSGGFGNVWQAVSEGGHVVALKWAHDAGGAETLAREAEVAALALSPRLPELFDVGWAVVPTMVAAGVEVRASTALEAGATPFVALT